MDFTKKNTLFQGWFWFKFSNLGLTFYTNMTKGLNLKVRMFKGLIATTLEVKGEKLIKGGGLCSNICSSFIKLTLVNKICKGQKER